MGELTGEEWFVSHWRRDRSARPDAGTEISWAEHEAEQVWRFARCETAVLELASLEARLYYGPVGSVEGFSQASPEGPVQFNMELYGDHHSARFSVHEGRLNVLNQLPELEPLDLFVRQLNESLERSGRRLVAVTEAGGTLRLEKSEPPTAAGSPRRRRRLVFALAAIVGLAGVAVTLLAWPGQDSSDDAEAVSWVERAVFTSHPAVDCRLGSDRTDPAIEVRSVTVDPGDRTGVVTVQLAGAPFQRFSTTVDIVATDDPVLSVASGDALTYRFLAGRRWVFERHDGVVSASSSVTGPGGRPLAADGAAPVVAVEPHPDGHESVRLVIADFPPLAPGFAGSVIVTTFGTADDNGGAGPEACTANVLTVPNG